MTIINTKDSVDLKESKEGSMQGLEGGMGREKQSNFIIIRKTKLFKKS